MKGSIDYITTQQECQGLMTKKKKIICNSLNRYHPSSALNDFFIIT